MAVSFELFADFLANLKDVFPGFSTSTGNLVATKIDRFRRSSDHELLTNALFEVSGKPRFYEGNMLKKPDNKKKRSKSIDANAQSRIFK